MKKKQRATLQCTASRLLTRLQRKKEEKIRKILQDEFSALLSAALMDQYSKLIYKYQLSCGNINTWDTVRS